MNTIRRLTAQDAPQLWRLRLEALETDPQAFRETAAEHRRRSVESYARQLGPHSNRSFVIGAFDNDANLVGMGGFYSNQPDAGCIWGMYITLAHRGAGLAVRLVNAIVEVAQSNPDIHAITSPWLTPSTPPAGSTRAAASSSQNRSQPPFAAPIYLRTRTTWFCISPPHSAEILYTSGESMHSRWL